MESSDQDSEKKFKWIDGVLHTSEQRTASEKHVELLKQRGGNAVLFPCSEISSLESKSMDDLSSLHLIVDTGLYRILMDDGYLCDVARRKFKELDKSGKKIHVLNTLPMEFENLFLQIPRNARTRLDEDNSTGVYGEDSSHHSLKECYAKVKYSSTLVLKAMESSDQDSEKKFKWIDGVLHTSEQRTASEKHVELLKQRGGNAVLFPCSEISSLESKSMDDLSSLHLIVDTSLYRILMDDGYLCAVARRKFKELDKSGKRIHVLNTLPLEFEELFLQIPRNARTRWDEDNSTGVFGEDSTQKQTDGNLPKLETLGQGDFQVKGPSGGTMGTANVAGTIDGGMGNTNNESSMVVHTARNYPIINQAIGDEGIPSITVEEGSQESSQNWFKITIKNTKQQDQEIYERLTNEKETLKSEDIHAVEIHRDSVIIKLSVDKSCIMTDGWIHAILQKIFHVILKDFFTEETVQVMCERHISMGVEHLLEMYSSHHSYDECHVKVKGPNLA